MVRRAIKSDSNRIVTRIADAVANPAFSLLQDGNTSSLSPEGQWT